MSTVKKVVGKIPVGRGAYSASNRYYKENTVTLYGMSFRALCDMEVGFAPATINSAGSVILTNTDKWQLLSGTPEAYQQTSDIQNLNANTGISENPAFDPAVDYAVGDVVVYEGRLKRFVTEHAAGEWIGTDVESWSEKKEVDEKVTELEQEVYKSIPNSDLLAIAEERQKYYIVANPTSSASKGDIVSTSKNISISAYIVDIRNFVGRKIYIESSRDYNNCLYYAFYNSEKADSDSYIDAKFAEAGDNNLYRGTIEIPQNAVMLAITVYKDILPNPKIVVLGTGISYYDYCNNAINASEKRLNGVLIYTRTRNNSVSNTVDNVDISNDSIGTQYRIEITWSGENAPTVALAQEKEGSSFFVSTLLYLSQNFIFFEKTTTSSLLKINKTKNSDGSEHSIVINVYRLPASFSLLYRSYTSYVNKLNQQLELGELLQGYWHNDNAFELYKDNAWVTYPIQYTQGYRFRINADFSTYYVSIKTYNSNYNRSEELIINDSDTIIDTNGYLSWVLQFRRIDRKYIVPNDVKDDVVIEIVGNATYYERPITMSESSKQVAEVENKVAEVENKVAEVENKIPTIPKPYIVNPFATNPYYAHYAANTFIKDGQGRKAIASESLEDIAIMARLGYTIIEANIHKNASGDYVVIHGDTSNNPVTFGDEVIDISNSTLGSNIAISETTTEYMKENIRYNSEIEKYRTPVPTLEEFCQCCKENNISIFAGTADRDAIAICRRYLGSNMILYNPDSAIREIYNGWVYIWNNSKTTTIDALLEQADRYGAPYMCGIGPNVLSNLTENGELDNFIYAMHEKGYLVGVAAVYQSEAQVRDFFRRGGDFAAAGHEVNPFESNYELFDIDNADNITTTGIITDGVATLIEGQTLSCGSTTAIPLGKGSLTIRFSGTIKVLFGSLATRTITSDGTEYINITDFFLNRKTQLVITANSDVNITSFVYKTSKC